MKKLLLLVVCAISLCACGSRADNEKIIQMNQLPATAQQLVKKYFAKRTVAAVKEESEFMSKSYEVIFADGDNIDFDGKGNWKDIDCKFTAVPDALVPQQILKYVRATYPGVAIKSIDKDKRHYELELANRVDLKFDKDFNLVDIDN